MSVSGVDAVTNGFGTFVSGEVFSAARTTESVISSFAGSTALRTRRSALLGIRRAVCGVTGEVAAPASSDGSISGAAVTGSGAMRRTIFRAGRRRNAGSLMMRFRRRVGRDKSFWMGTRRRTGLVLGAVFGTVFFFAPARIGLAVCLTLARTARFAFVVLRTFLGETFFRMAFFFFGTGRREARAGALGLRGATFFALAAGFRAAVGFFAFIRGTRVTHWRLFSDARVGFNSASCNHFVPQRGKLGKLQAPTSKLQRNTKHQISNTPGGCLLFEV